MSKPTVIDVQPLVVTDEKREEVAAMAAHGLSAIEIAAVLKVDPGLVARSFATELAHGLALATAKVGGALYTRAVNGDTKAATFWLQARAGWRNGAAAPKEEQPGSTKSDLVDRILGMLTPDQLAAAVKTDPPTAAPSAPPGTRH